MIDQNVPLLVFGGPYSNLQATVAIRSIADELAIPPSNIICTGDVIAYAAAPEETARLIHDWGIAVVAGNCEEQLAAGAADCGCGFEEGSQCDLLSKGWYPFANASISPDMRTWMAGLQPALAFSYNGVRFHALHGGTRQNNRFIFASDRPSQEEEASTLDTDIVLAGHAGIPFISEVANKIWLNAGVIGMPANDGTPDGWYALVRPEAGGNLRLSLHRLPYDHVSAAAAMRRAGHANGYARTLVTGIWPSHDVLPGAERAATGTPLPEASVLVPTPTAAAA